MERLLLIDDNLIETRLALMEGDRLRHLAIAPRGDDAAPGDIYLGRVSAIDPNLNGAFLDLGGGRTGFIKAAHAVKAAALSNQRTRPGPSGAASGTDKNPHISDLISEGEKFPVQVLKQARPGKDAEVTTRLEIAGSLSLIRPLSQGQSVARRIRDAGRRAELTALGERVLAARSLADLALTWRSAAEQATPADLEAELGAQLDRWQEITGRLQTMSEPGAVEPERGPLDRILTELPPETGDELQILVDRPLTEKAVQQIFARARPSLCNRVKVAAAGALLFDQYHVEAEIETALERTVPLPSGGNLVFDATEAMMVVDINSAAHQGGPAPAKAAARGNFAFDVNREAVIEIARQIRLRNIGGIIVIDCLQMSDKTDTARLLAIMAENVADDPNRVHVAGMSPLGLLEISRRRKGPSLRELLLSPAEPANAEARQLRAGALAARIIRRATQEIRAGGKGPLMIRTRPQIIELLTAIKPALEVALGRNIELNPLAEENADGYTLSFPRAG